MRIFAIPILFAVSGSGLAAELSSVEKKLAAEISDAVRRAGTAYADADYQGSGEALRSAMDHLDAAAHEGSAELFQELQPAIARIQRAHTILEFEGVSLPPLLDWQPRSPSPSAGPGPSTSAAGPTSRRQRPPQRPPSSLHAVSFMRSVAPILLSRCGSCHIQQSRGGLSMASYAALMKGPPEGVVIFPGDLVASRLIETIESGDMPRGGDKLTAAELATLKLWVQSGAPFDGDDPNAPLDAAAERTAGRASPMVNLATGSESVSFAKQVAPLLVANCQGCHLEAANPRGGLRLDTFADLLRGGDSGAVLQPGAGDQSLLVQKLLGTADGQRMPAGGRPPLPPESIRLITTWIDEGAKLDGDSERQPIRVLSQLAWAAAATPAEISSRREQQARQSLALALAGRTLHTEVTENLFVVGPVDAETIRLVAGAAEAQLGLARAVLGTGDGPLFRGRATVIVLPQRYEYNEFTRMVEQRSVPADWTSHWRFDGVDAYVAVIADASDPAAEIAARLAAPLVSLAVATAGDVPAWLAGGVGQAVAGGQTDRRDRLAQQQAEAETAAAFAALTRAEQFLDGQMTPEHSARVATAVANSLIQRSARRHFAKLIQALETGTPFVKAFADAYGMTPNSYVQSFLDRWRASRQSP